jgi:hypothetical protein
MQNEKCSLDSVNADVMENPLKFHGNGNLGCTYQRTHTTKCILQHGPVWHTKLQVKLPHLRGTRVQYIKPKADSTALKHKTCFHILPPCRISYQKKKKKTFPRYASVPLRHVKHFNCSGWHYWLTTKHPTAQNITKINGHMWRSRYNTCQKNRSTNFGPLLPRLKNTQIIPGDGAHNWFANFKPKHVPFTAAWNELFISNPTYTQTLSGTHKEMHFQ